MLSAFLLVVAFPAHHTPELAYACLAPGVIWAYLRPSLRLYAGTLFVSQAVAWTIILWWLHPVTYVGLFLLGPLVGAWTGIWYLAVWWVMPRMLGKPNSVRLVAMLGLCGAWVLVEWSRTWVFGGFPWMPLAATQWERIGVLQLAAYTGASGVSFVIVAVNVGFAAYAHRLFREGRRGFARRSQEFLLAMFLLLVCLSVLVSDVTHRDQFTEPFTRVAFIQPDIPSTAKWEPAQADHILRTLAAQTQDAAKSVPDLILWPESTTPYPLHGGDPGMGKFVSALAHQAKAPLLVAGSVTITPPSWSTRTWGCRTATTPSGGWCSSGSTCRCGPSSAGSASSRRSATISRPAPTPRRCWCR